MRRVFVLMMAALAAAIAVAVAGGTARAYAPPDGTLNPPSVYHATDATFMVYVDTAACSTFAGGSTLLFNATYDSVLKVWMRSNGDPPWWDRQERVSGSLSSNGETYTLRGKDSFRGSAEMWDDLSRGTGSFTLTRSDGARISGDAQIYYDIYLPGPVRDHLVWTGIPECR